MTLDRSKRPDLSRIERDRSEKLLAAHQRQLSATVVRSTLTAVGTSIPIPVFSHPGTLTVSESPPWAPSGTVAATAVRCLLGTAGSSTSTVVVQKNGSTVCTVTLVSTDTDQTANISGGLTLTSTDLLTVEITGVGTSAANLTVIIG